NDGAWHWLRRRFALRDTTILALYRAYFVYGGCRIFAWFAWARWRRHAPLDWSWGGPFWVHKATTHNGTASGILLRTVYGAVGLSLFCAVLWWLVLGPLWRRAGEPQALPERVIPMMQEAWGDLAVYA